MGLFDCFPISIAYSVNVDWIMRKIKELEKYIADYTAVNNVAYAGVWDITKQYPKWALVTNGDTSYLSLQPVPVGIPLENGDYWQKLADLDPRIAGIIAELDALQKDLVNVRIYGAVGDGVTDDSDAIQRAANENHVLFFPEGKYLISKTISIRGGTFVYGCGVSSELAAADDFSGDMLFAENAYNIVIENMAFTANRNANAIHLTTASETTIYNCKIVRAGKNAILFDGDPAILPRILYNIIRGDENAPNLGCGISLEYGCSDHVITGNDIGWLGTGILLSQSEGGIIDNNMVWQCSTAFDIYDSDRGRIINCLADFSKTYSFKFTSVDDAIVTNCICKNGSVSGSGAFPAYGLYGQCTNCVFDNNMAIGDNYSYAFFVENATNVDIKNVKTSFNRNIIHNNGDFSNGGISNNLNIDGTTVQKEGCMANINVASGNNTIGIEDFLTKNLNCYGSSGTIVIPKIYTTFIVRNSTAGSLTITNGVGTKELTSGMHIVTATVNGIFSTALN